MSKAKIRTIVVAATLSIWFAVVLFQSCGRNQEPQSEALLQTENTFQLADSMYVGSETCASCHNAEYKDWQGSHHDLAMMEADSQSVKGNFNDQTFTSQGVTHRFFMRNGDYYVNTEGGDGQYQDYKILYTFGIEPLQQYIVEFPKGQYQCLRTAWDTEKGGWFDLYPDMKVVHSEWIHWTKGGLRWNTMCADCHSTFLRKNYHVDTESYDTKYTWIDVGCESCHGPGEAHVAAASHPDYKGYTPGGEDKLYLTSDLSSKQQVDGCARCHSLRTQFTPFFDHQGEYMDHYAPDLLREGQYFPDGQILGEVYVYASFIQSKMYMVGVECADCHNVHSLELKVQGNALCNQCHAPQTYDTPSHHFHTINTEGAECISCHMPGRYYMGNDFRRDHSFRLPRPDLSVRYDTPNACTGCHEDRSDEWAAAAVEKWYGPDRPPHWSSTLAMGRAAEAHANDSLMKLALNAAQPPMARATAIYYAARMADQKTIDGIVQLLEDPDPLVRYTSVNSLEYLPNEHKVTYLAPRLTDDVRSVRIAAASAFVGIPDNMMNPQTRANYKKSHDEFFTGLMVRADFPGGQMELARYYEKINQWEKAERAYLKAIEFDYFHNAARVNLAGLYYSQGKFEQAEALFTKVIEQEPQFGQAYYSMGLLKAEQNLMNEAADYLKKALELIDYNERVAYNYGLVLQNLGRIKEAEAAFKKGMEMNPASEVNLYALSYLYFNQKQFAQAKAIMDKLLALQPDNADYRQLAAAIAAALQ